MIAHPGSNSLVVSDRASNVQRLVAIIQRIDTVSDAQVEVIPLTHANASEMARTLTLLADDKTAAPGSEAQRCSPTTRTNSDPGFRREGGTPARCARWSRIWIRRWTTAATRR